MGNELQSESVVPSGCYARGPDRCAANASRSRNALRIVARARTLSSDRNWPETVARNLLDPEADYEALLVNRNDPRWTRMLKNHGEIEVLPDHSIRVKRHQA